VQGLADLFHEGSAIVNVASMEASHVVASTGRTSTIYASTKAALKNLTETLAAELGPRGIRVNAVAPGPVWTPLIASTITPESVAHFGESNPTGRPAQPAELAPAYVFLASSDSRFVTGEVIGVTGGRLLP